MFLGGTGNPLLRAGLYRGNEKDQQKGRASNCAVGKDFHVLLRLRKNQAKISVREKNAQGGFKGWRDLARAGKLRSKFFCGDEREPGVIRAKQLCIEGTLGFKKQMIGFMDLERCLSQGEMNSRIRAGKGKADGRSLAPVGQFTKGFTLRQLLHDEILLERPSAKAAEENCSSTAISTLRLFDTGQSKEPAVSRQGLYVGFDLQRLG
jgi:hypothetical protein